MAMKFGKAEIDNLKKRAEGAMNRMRSIREKAEETAGRVVQIVTINGTAFGFGYLNGRMVNDRGERGVELFGVPVEAIAGIGLHLLGFMSSNKYGEHLHNFGNGALAAYSTTMGVEIGEKMRQNALTAARAAAPAASPPPSLPAGTPPATNGNWRSGAYGGMTDAQLAQIANMPRR